MGDENKVLFFFAARGQRIIGYTVSGVMYCTMVNSQHFYHVDLTFVSVTRATKFIGLARPARLAKQV